jgi:putative nucleotidyltransferase with HDIG domain
VSVEERLASEEPVRAVREALAGSAADAWVVGGTVRDALLGRPVRDVDLAVAGDPEPAARAVADALHGPVFRLSETFGAWRAIDRDRRYVCDLSPLQGAGIEEDLARRDFTVNAMALPLGGGELLDPHGGRSDLDDRVLRVVGPSAYTDDALRPLRLARLAAELGLRPEPETEELTRAAAPRVPTASAERIYAELRRLLIAPAALEGLDLAERLGLLAAVLPEVSALKGVEQSHFHHLDVYDHTMEVLGQQIALETGLEEVFGDLAPRLQAVLDEPLADELSRCEALRFGALLHDIGKPATRGRRPDGRVTFIGHDSVGEEMVLSLCRRLRTSERMARFVAGVTRHHLVLGFLVHQRPLERRTVYRYLRTTEPVEVEVTLLSCADRLATRGRNAEPAIAAHLELASELMEEALEWRSSGPPRSPLRGDELADELGIEPGPELGALIARLEEAAFAGEVRSRQEAVELARRVRQNPQR